MAGAEPQRRCVGCGRVTAKRALLRLAVAPQQPGVPARVVVDRAARLAGRGAYVCGIGPCLQDALRRRALQRAFRRPVTIDLKTLESTD